MNQQINEKSNPKSCQNGQKIHEKSIKNWSNSRSGGRLGPSWGVLGRLGGLLKASWAVWSRKRWPTWLQLGSQNGAEIEKKSKQKSIQILMPLGVRFFQDFGGFWRQNGAKLAPKSHQKSIPTSKGDLKKKHYFSVCMDEPNQRPHQHPNPSRHPPRTGHTLQPVRRLRAHQT